MARRRRHRERHSGPCRSPTATATSSNRSGNVCQPLVTLADRRDVVKASARRSLGAAVHRELNRPAPPYEVSINTAPVKPTLLPSGRVKAVSIGRKSKEAVKKCSSLLPCVFTAHVSPTPLLCYILPAIPHHQRSFQVTSRLSRASPAARCADARHALPLACAEEQCFCRTGCFAPVR